MYTSNIAIILASIPSVCSIYHIIWCIILNITLTEYNSFRVHIIRRSFVYPHRCTLAGGQF